MLSQGVFIFGYLAVLTVLEFFVAVTFEAIALLIVVALVKAALVVYYYMHIYKLNAEHEGDHNSYEYKSGTNRIGLWLFLISDSFVFGGLLVMRMNLLGLTRPNLNPTLGLAVTSILLISSFFMNRGETMMSNGDRKGFLNNTLITFLLGLGFLIGVVAVEWRLAAHEGLTPSSGAAGAAFYMMTGMHAFHVLTGLIFLAIVWFNGRRGLYDEKHYPVEAAAVYWHFVDVVWIFFYPALYLIGTVIL
ncbi:MAG: heme-copper oxidase subunit III [Anaerolineales bacterium]|nr:heme-copper oxidase subunit III [Anaerolineae bacterium]PWB78046.1 MAG: heme-copper oxidase subunit III [Anaerolineales bacterium]